MPTAKPKASTRPTTNDYAQMWDAYVSSVQADIEAFAEAYDQQQAVQREQVERAARQRSRKQPHSKPQERH